MAKAATELTNDARKLWASFYITCVGALLVTIDTTVVNVALPTIRADLRLSDTGMIWVVDAYTLTYAGFLILGGRLSDYFGGGRVFLAGIAVFGAASLGCGWATSPGILVGARAIQGFGGAIVDATALSLVTQIFPDESARAKAIGIIGFINSIGATVGVLFGGAITGMMGWHWVFFINVPIGLLVYVLAMTWLPPISRSERPERLDWAGATTITLSVVLAIYSITTVSGAGWISWESLGGLGASTLALLLFFAIEERVSSPLVPPYLGRLRNVVIANVATLFWSVALAAWLVIGTLYLQVTQGLTPSKVGVIFALANATSGISAIFLSSRLATQVGIKRSLVCSFLTVGFGLLLLGGFNTGGAALDALPGMLLVGFGAGMGFNSLLLSATNDIPPKDAGISSGIWCTSYLLGSALGVAILTSAAASRHTHLADSMTNASDGYRTSFFLGAASAVVGAGVVCYLIKPPLPSGSHSHRSNP